VSQGIETYILALLLIFWILLPVLIEFTAFLMANFCVVGLLLY
jgi:hypothetical protein